MAREEMFICSKLGQNLSEMEVRTFVRIQKIIWDYLLLLRLKVSGSKVHFSFRAERHAAKNCRLVMLSVLFFVSSSFLARRGKFFV